MQIHEKKRFGAFLAGAVAMLALMGATPAPADQPETGTPQAKAAPAPSKGTPPGQEKTQAKAKPRIRILATGGTIAGAQTAPTDVGYKSGTFKVEDLISAVPNLKDVANLSGEQIVNIGSQDMNDKVWLQLAKRLNEVLQSPDVDGVVITHGTDTLEETAYFLDLVAKSEKPVVLVGSMRPATATSADGPANLYNAVSVAANPRARGRGVLVVLNDEIFSARDIEKVNTTNVQAFASPERGLQGTANNGKIRWFEPTDKKHTENTEFSVQKLDALPRVDIIYAHANMSPDLIDAAVRDGAKGIVIAGVGDGNMTKPAATELEKLVRDRGILVVRSTRVPTGVVLRNSEINDDQSGFVASGELNPAKARVLAQLALTKTNDPQQVQKMFEVY